MSGQVVGAPKYTIGIDLGTSNCAVAFADLGVSNARLNDFQILQAQRQGQTAGALLLPSVLYAPTDQEWAAGGLTMPWQREGQWVVGQFARWRGAKVPGRVVTSAKSWLSHPGVDRTAPILPYGGAEDVPRISPVAASAHLLRHMREAWNAAHPSEPLESQEVVITVPASFDEVARGLTVKAALEAGIEHFTLVEEPQAAFYHFSHHHQSRLAQVLDEVRLVLVVDVGGGTTDFTLVQVGASDSGPLLKRIAVGDHLILGGDNMDNTLARRVEEKLKRKLTPAQWIQLVQAAREAKEALLGAEAPAETRISIAGEGSQLLGSAISQPISRAELEEIILDGFFPRVKSSELPRKTARGGIQEMGLPYAADPAITRHLAAFLAKHGQAGFDALGLGVREGLPRPDAILLNGGVFNSNRLVDRLIEVISGWWPDQPPIRLLAHGHLDLAVARGAAAYGLVRHGVGRRISGGTAHSFYLGIASEGEKQEAICLIPRGLEEGEAVELKQQVFKLQLGKPVQFPLFTSTADRVDRPGDIASVSEELQPLPPIQTLLKTNKPMGEKIPVYLRGRLTEIGTVELWCVAVEGREQWRLEFDVRGQAAAGEMTVVASLPPGFDEARDAVVKVYGNKPGPTEKSPRDAKQLWNTLERTLGARDSWNLPTLRHIAGELLGGAGKRRRSADHERVFFQLLGYTLRPGFGFPLDDWRSEQAGKLFGDRVEFHKEKPNWNEFWVMWRRISGGLPPSVQSEMWEGMKPWLTLRVPAKAPKNFVRPKGVQPEGTDEMVRTAASLEHVSAEEKGWLGDLISNRLQATEPAGGPWAWSLGRLGSRVPLYGSLHNCVAPEIAERWISTLLKVDPDKAGGAFALAQLARLTGDRLRDVSEQSRQEVKGFLKSRGHSPEWVKMVTEVAELKTAEAARVFGDTLPIGLQLSRANSGKSRVD